MEILDTAGQVRIMTTPPIFTSEELRQNIMLSFLSHVTSKKKCTEELDVTTIKTKENYPNFIVTL